MMRCALALSLLTIVAALPAREHTSKDVSETLIPDAVKNKLKDMYGEHVPDAIKDKFNDVYDKIKDVTKMPSADEIADKLKGIDTRKLRRGMAEATALTYEYGNLKTWEPLDTLGRILWKSNRAAYQFDPIFTFSRETCSLSSLGATIDEASVFRVSIQETEMVAFGALFKSSALPGSDSFIALTFRGTDSTMNWMTDAGMRRANAKNRYTCDFNPGAEKVVGVHAGFCDMYLSGQAEIVSGMKALIAKYPDVPVIVSGHSLGGGLAQVAAYDLSQVQGLPLAMLVTFASPRAFKAKLALAFAKAASKAETQLWRLTEGTDIVPQMPPMSTGFAHVGAEVFWPSGGDAAFENTPKVFATSEDLGGIDGHATLGGLLKNGKIAGMKKGYWDKVTNSSDHAGFFNDRGGCMTKDRQNLTAADWCKEAQGAKGGEILGLAGAIQTEKKIHHVVHQIMGGLDCDGSCDSCKGECREADATLYDWPAGNHCNKGTEAVVCCSV